MAKPTLTSKTGSESELVAYASNVVKKSQENAALFPDAEDKVTAVQAALSIYMDSKSDAAFRDMRQIVIKNQQASRLRELLYDLSLHVESIAKGDPALLLAAGFIPRKTKSTSVGFSPKATNLRAVVTQPGTNTVQLQVARWAYSRYYQFEYRKLGSQNPWTTVLSTKSKVAVSGLEYLQEYEFRVTYLGSVPEPNYSDVVVCAVV